MYTENTPYWAVENWALAYCWQLYMECKLQTLSGQEIDALWAACTAFDRKLERDWEINELKYMIDENFAFPEIVAWMTEWLLKNLSYKDWQYRVGTTLDLPPSEFAVPWKSGGKSWEKVITWDLPTTGGKLWYMDELKLTYAKRRLFDSIRVHGDPNKEIHSRVMRSLALSDFFTREFGKLADQYPDAYSDADRAFYVDTHAPEEFLEKMWHKTRFIKCTYDSQRNIVAYLESRQSPTYSDVQVVQWFLTDENMRQKGEIRKLWSEFITWCEENWYTSVWSYSALRNEVSLQVHDALMNNPLWGIHDPYTLVLVQFVANISRETV